MLQKLIKYIKWLRGGKPMVTYSGDHLHPDSPLKEADEGAKG